MEDKESRPSRSAGSLRHELSDRAAYTAPGWVCMGWNPRAKRNGLLPPSLTQKPSPTTSTDKSVIFANVLLSGKKLLLRVGCLPNSRCQQRCTHGHLRGFLGSQRWGRDFFLNLFFPVFNPPGPLCIYYSIQCCTFMGFLSIQASGSLNLYLLLVPFLGLFPSVCLSYSGVFVFVLSYYILLLSLRNLFVF